MVCVLLSTYNGAKYLHEQLVSLVNQNDVEVEIIVRDDGSTDGTKDILNEWQAKGLLTWYGGKNLKPAMSFMDLLSKAPIADFYAFCDQDDVWLPEKLSVATSRLSEFKIDSPSLYISETQLVDENLKKIESQRDVFLNSFGESLVINISTGCTNVFNYALFKVLAQYTPPFIDMHDSWVYKVCLAIGGDLYHDRTSYVLYRQHSNNVIGGMGDSTKSKLKRRIEVLKGTKGGERYKMALSIYDAYYDLLPLEHRITLSLICKYKSNLFAKTRLLFSNRLHTNSFKQNIILKLSILLNSY